MKKDKESSQVKIYVTGLVTGVIPILFSTSLSTEVASKVTEAEVYIDRYYWKEPGTAEEMSDAALKGMLYSLGDKYSQYYTKNEYDETMNHVEGDYAGIGATISIDLKTLKKTIKEVQKDSPA